MAQQAGLARLADGEWARRALALIRRSPDLAALVAMALVGLGISIYLTAVHYAHVRLVCTSGGVVNCAQVTSSAYSVVPGTQIPITIPGMLWFLASGGLALAAWRARASGKPEPARIRPAHAIWGGLGLLFVLYLVYVEIVRLHAICEWCTAVHVLTLLTFLVALYRLQQGPDAGTAPAAAAAHGSSPATPARARHSGGGASAPNPPARRGAATRSLRAKGTKRR
jgi:uncharacterized membrane protein